MSLNPATKVYSLNPPRSTLLYNPRPAPARVTRDATEASNKSHVRASTRVTRDTAEASNKSHVETSTRDATNPTAKRYITAIDIALGSGGKRIECQHPGHTDVTLYVGKGRIECRVHGDKLRQLSFFETALQGPEKTVSMPKDVPAVISTLLEWLYTGDYKYNLERWIHKLRKLAEEEEDEGGGG